jgi:hypothetical protein
MNPTPLTCEHEGCNETEGVKDYPRQDPYLDGDDLDGEPVALCPKHAPKPLTHPKQAMTPEPSETETPFCDARMKAINEGRGYFAEYFGAIRLEDARQLEKRARRAEGALRASRNALDATGEWDDGCFYLNGRSASQFEGPMKIARAALAE